MPLWYVVRDGECWAWTYAKSQKVRNLERESRCTLQVEAGTAYDELRGVMIKCVVRDPPRPGDRRRRRHGAGARYGGGAYEVTPRAGGEAGGAAVRVVNATASWDHRKLAGADGRRDGAVRARASARRACASAPSGGARRVVRRVLAAATAAASARCSATLVALRSRCAVLTRAIRRWRSRSVS